MQTKIPFTVKKNELIDLIVPAFIFYLAIGQRTSDANSFAHNFQWVFVGFASIAFFLLFLKVSPKLYSINHSWLLLLFISVLFISTVWSIEPVHTFISALWLLLSTLFSFFIILRFSFDRFLYLVFYGLMIVVILSMVSAIVSPGFAVHIKELHFGAWKGIYFHKSGLGKETALASVIGLFLLRKPFNILFYFLCFFIVYKTQSTISLLVLFAVFAYYVGSSLMNFVKQLKYKKVLLGFLILVVILAAIVTNYELAVTFLGKGNTFGARLVIWSYSIASLESNFLLGYGYDTFWLDDKLSTVLDWNVPHAHNHFIDVLLDVGMIGLFLFLALLFRYFYLINKLNHKTKEFDILFSSMLLIVGISLSEQTIYESFSMYWMYFVALILYSENPKKALYAR